MNNHSENQKIISECSTLVELANNHFKSLDFLLKKTIAASEAVSSAYSSNDAFFDMLTSKLAGEFKVNTSKYIDSIKEFNFLNKKLNLSIDVIDGSYKQNQLSYNDSVISPMQTWIPKRDQGLRFDFKNISLLKIPNYTTDSLEKLKKSMFGRFYNQHLKKNAITRHGFQFFYRLTFPILLKYKLRKTRFIGVPIISHAEFIEINKIQKSVIFHGEVLETPNPRVASLREASVLQSPHAFYEVPEIYIFEIKNAKVNGDSNFIFSDGQAIVHDLYDLQVDYTSEELHNRLAIKLGKNEASDLTVDIDPFELDCAISFLDSCASNYSHWLTEVLPRVASYCRNDYDKSVPILINSNLHINIKESLFSTVKPGTKIYEIPKGRSLLVKSLKVISVAGYVPFERRINSKGPYSHGIFFPKPIKLIRDNLIKPYEVKANYPKKLYIRRNSGVRQVININEIEIILNDNGFVFVEPEKLTFSEQVSLFSQADIVVGSSGAAMANLIFMKPDAAVVILIGEFRDTSYWYWANMAYASGLSNFNYVIGRQIEDSIHSDFYIDTILFQETINRI